MGFEVKPLRHYDGAHYPSPEEPEAERERPLSLKLLVVFFSLAMALGLMACVEEDKAADISIIDTKEVRGAGFERKGLY